MEESNAYDRKGVVFYISRVKRTCNLWCVMISNLIIYSDISKYQLERLIEFN